jgi:hypothetical protein
MVCVRSTTSCEALWLRALAKQQKGLPAGPQMQRASTISWTSARALLAQQTVAGGAPWARTSYQLPPPRGLCCHSAVWSQREVLDVTPKQARPAPRRPSYPAGRPRGVAQRLTCRGRRLDCNGEVTRPLLRWPYDDRVCCGML